MNNTNWPDVAVTFAACLLVFGLAAIGAWLVSVDHPGFGFMAMLMGACVSVKTGQDSK